MFDRFVALLCDGEVDGVPIPSVRRKIRAVLTGKMRIGSEDEPVDVISNGECWASCPVGIAERLAAVVGEEAFCKIERCQSMRSWHGWLDVSFIRHPPRTATATTTVTRILLHGFWLWPGQRWEAARPAVACRRVLYLVMNELHIDVTLLGL